MTARPVETVESPLLSVPVIPEPASALLLAGLGITPRRQIPDWITDPNLRADIEAGFADIPDDLRGA